MSIKILAVAGCAAALLAGCAYDDPYTPTGSATSTVSRDYWGNPVARSTTTDAYGRPLASSGQVYAAPAPVYGAPVYSGSSLPPAARPEAQIERDRRVANDVDCRANLLHQDRPGGSDYDPRRGAPSC